MTIDQKIIIALGEHQFNRIVQAHQLEEAQKLLAALHQKVESDQPNKQDNANAD